MLIRVLTMLCVSLMQGCLWISDPDIWPSEFIDKTTLPGLVGKKDTQAVEMFGPPTYVVHVNDDILYLYEKREEDSAYPLAALPIDLLFMLTGSSPGFYTVYGREVSCVLLEFDNKKELKEYKTKTTGAATSRQMKISKPKYDNCLGLFDLYDSEIILGREYMAVDSDQSAMSKVDLTDSGMLPRPDYVASGCDITASQEVELPNQELLTGSEYIPAGSDLNTSQQYKLYLSYSPNDPTRLCYLCLAADNEHPNAQIEVGRHISQGIYGIHTDLRRAYVWYSLAARGGIDTHIRLIRHKMTNKQITEAEQMLVDWEPGQCERDLSQISKDDNLEN